MREIRFLKNIGDKVDKLTLTQKEVMTLNGLKRRYWICLCDCGGSIKRREDAFFGRKHQSCGCDTKAIQSANTRRIKWKGVGLLSSTVFTSCLRNAKIRQIPFGITIEDAWKQFEKQKGLCALSGVPLVFSKNTRWRRNDQTASIDRIDSSKGYMVNNIQWVHKTVNLMKNTSPESEFLEWCQKIADFNKV